jgi:hypothetical protein
LSNELAKLDVPVKLLIDSAVAYTMDEVDMVLVGADGVVESGGIINMMGTYQIALVAHSMNKPVYVAAESYKVCQPVPLGLNRYSFNANSLVINQLEAAHILNQYFIINRNLTLEFGLWIWFSNFYLHIDTLFCSLLVSIHWTRKTWVLLYALLISGFLFHRRLRLKHRLGIILLLSILLCSSLILVY